MLFLTKLISLVALIFIIAACNASPELPESEAPDVSTLCKDPRPQMCTMIYQPVCGVDNAGQFKTYSSNCSACSHVEVKGFNEGACEDESGANK